MDKNNINIEIIGVKVEDVPAKTGNKTYKQMTVMHQDLSTGKNDGKKLVEFYTNKELWQRLVDAKSGEVYSLERQKNEKGYWDWMSVARQDSAVKPATEGAPRAAAAKNTYEVNNEINIQRFEFEKEKQPLIVRQSCLSSAVALGAAHGLGSDATLQLAEQFYNWVMRDGIKFIESDEFPEVN